MSRSPLKHKLNSEELHYSELCDVERLANFLKLSIERKLLESDNNYKHRLIKAIQRWEKEYARGL